MLKVASTSTERKQRYRWVDPEPQDRNHRPDITFELVDAADFDAAYRGLPPAAVHDHPPPREPDAGGSPAPGSPARVTMDNRGGANMSANEERLSVVHCATGGTYAVTIRGRLADVRSEYQHILVVDTAEFGRCLVLDGVMQTSDSDHLIYDDALLRRVRAEDRRVLIVGGGDGYVARRTLTRAPEARVLVVDIDPLVVSLANEHLNPGFALDPGIDVRIGDGRAIAAALAPGSLDGVALDLTDIPLDPGQGAAVIDLYRDMLAVTFPLLRPGGWLSVQGGPSEVAGEHLDVAGILAALLAGRLADVVREDVYLPSYAERNAFFHGIAP